MWLVIIIGVSQCRLQKSFSERSKRQNGRASMTRRGEIDVCNFNQNKSPKDKDIENGHKKRYDQV